MVLIGEISLNRIKLKVQEDLLIQKQTELIESYLEEHTQQKDFDMETDTHQDLIDLQAQIVRYRDKDQIRALSGLSFDLVVQVAKLRNELKTQIRASEENQSNLILN